jgi:hypothetical protein
MVRKGVKGVALMSTKNSQGGARGLATGRCNNIHGTILPLQTGKLSMATCRSPLHDPPTIIASIPSSQRACTSSALASLQHLCRGPFTREQADTHDPGVCVGPGDLQRRVARFTTPCLAFSTTSPHWPCMVGGTSLRVPAHVRQRCIPCQLDARTAVRWPCHSRAAANEV